MNNKKLILTGKIKLLSPTLIGCGEANHSDMDVLRDCNGYPFIPATSFIGVLRHFVNPEENGLKDNLKKFWGYAEGNKGRQSSISCSDLTLCDVAKQNVVIRDGVKISNKTGMAESGLKYDYEVIEPGAEFTLYIEVDIQKSEDEEPNNEFEKFSRRMIKTICTALSEKRIYIGAKTNSGLGKIMLVDHKVYEFDLTNKDDVISWLKRGDRNFSSKTPLTLDDSIKTIELKGKQFKIKATFYLKDSLIVRTYPAGTGDQPDAVHIKSAGKAVLPGTSLKGAIRARAERILNTLFEDNGKAKEILDNLFGVVIEGDKEKNIKSKSIKSRIRIDEITLDGFLSEIQTRIQINRFTGGTIEGALIETMPLFSAWRKAATDNGNEVKNITITINDYESYEAGLMLLVLKDLWTGDLAVGGEKAIGRGVFQGKEADIFFEDKEKQDLTIDDSFFSSPDENGWKKRLQEEYIEKLKALQ